MFHLFAGCLLSAEAILLALLKIQMNAIAVIPKEHASAKDRIAVAIYPKASMMNHGCIPNVELEFKGRQLRVNAIDALAAGDILRLCYGPQVK